DHTGPDAKPRCELARIGKRDVVALERAPPRFPALALVARRYLQEQVPRIETVDAGNQATQLRASQCDLERVGLRIARHRSEVDDAEGTTRACRERSQ